MAIKLFRPRFLTGFIFRKSKFQRDVWWNALTFVAMAVSGLALNILIIVKYGAEILGVFNQVYAIYILISHLAVFGLYASVLKHISEHSENRQASDEIITSALLIGLVIASLVSFIYYLGASLMGKLLDSPLVVNGLIFSSVGLWCFSINKILLAFLNGKRLMKAFALFYAFRYLMLPLSLVGLILLDLPGYTLPLIFSLAEFFLFIGLVIFSFRFFSIIPINQCKRWFKIHLFFGGKSLVGGSISDLNTRVDVLMLGAFLSDKLVGVYSLAAMLAEGIDQITNIFKVNYNPLLTKLIVAKRFKELCLMVGTFLKKWLPFALMIGFLSILVFPLFVKVIAAEPEFLKGWLVFAILIAGIVVKSGYAVFWELPSQAGYPGHQTILITMVVLSNVILNYFFILQWGIYGAAAATAISFILGIFYLKIIVKKLLGVTI